jgi:hypothetical protein
MRVINLKNIKMPQLTDNTPEYLSRPYPRKAFPLHLLSAVIGGRGSGKTSIALRLIKWYLQSKSYDRILIWSTTANKDPKMKAFMRECEQNENLVDLTLYESYNPADLQNEMERCEEDVKE